MNAGGSVVVILRAARWKRERKAERDGTVRIESQPHVPEPPEALRHQSRTDQECERKGDLPRHKNRSDELLAVPGRRAAAPPGERAGQVGPPPRAQECHAREQAGTREREAKEDGHDGEVYTHLAEARNVVRREPEVDPDGRARQDEAERTANGCENNTLSQEATPEVTVCRAERLRDRDLVPQSLGAHEAQVGRIRPGDEQQEPTGREQEQERHAYVADYRVLERYHRPAQPHRFELRLGHVREGVWQGVDEAMQVSPGLRERTPRLESSHRAGPEGAKAGFRRVGRRPPEGQPDVGLGVRERSEEHTSELQ